MRNWLFAALALFAGSAWADYTTQKRLYSTDFTYVGAFRVPNRGGAEASTFDYGGTALGLGTNELYLVGHTYQQRSAAISIPTPVNTTTLSSLNEATLTQSFSDITDGKRTDVDPTPETGIEIGGQFVYGSKLIVTAYSYYDGAGDAIYSHFHHSPTLATGSVTGPYLVGTDAHYTSGYMAAIPSEWQTAFGGTTLTGMCCLSITSYQSNGPSATVFDPDTTTQTGTRVLGYPLANPLRDPSSTNSVYNLTSKISGLIFPPNTRTVLFIGRHGTGTYCYGGVPSPCTDPADDTSGTHAYPYVYQMWAYDANDLVAVKNGTQNQYDPEPYSVWTFTLPFEGNDTRNYLGGAAYDATNKKLYISQKGTDSTSPLIHVFNVDTGSALLPGPSNVRWRPRPRRRRNRTWKR